MHRERWFRRLLAWVLAGVALGAMTASAWSQVFPFTTTRRLQTAYSASGQFLVSGPTNLFLGEPLLMVTTNAPWVELTVATLVASCERVKSALLRELGAPDPWVGRIAVVINPQLTNNQPPLVGARYERQRWVYQMEVAPRVDPTKLVRGLVQVLLLERANRSAGRHSAEVPYWLVEGLTQQIIQGARQALVISRPTPQPNRIDATWSVQQGVRRNPLLRSRAQLQAHTPPTFAEMGQVSPEVLSAEDWRTYQAAAQLLVNELLGLPGGQVMLDRFLTLLPNYLNWQGAFLAAYQPQFQRMLDAEKWWSVVLVHFTGMDHEQAWTIPLALTKVNEALHPPVLVSGQAKDLPRRSRMSLQQLATQWDYINQRMVLRDVAVQLFLMRLRMPPELLGLTEEYRQSIEVYLQQRDKEGAARSLFGMTPTRGEAVMREFVRQLNALDKRRMELGVGPKAPPLAAGDQPATR